MDKFWVVWNPQGCNPTCRHSHEVLAHREAERLAENNPGQHFYVLAATMLSQYRKVQTIRLGQEEMGDELPF